MTRACDLYVTDMNLPTLTKNSLRGAGYETLGDIVLVDDATLRRIRGLGEKGLRRLRFVAHCHGYDILQTVA